MHPGISEYEQLRLDNIRRNEEQLRLLGLDVGGLTQQAAGRMAPTATTRRRRARPRHIPDGTERRSARNLGRPSPDYAEAADPKHATLGGSGSGSGSSVGGAAVAAASATATSTAAPAAAEDHRPLALVGGYKRQRITRAADPLPKPANARSCKNLTVDVERLASLHLGRIIPPLGGQVKRAAMEAAAGGSVTFSRMSGIQEWENAVALFINGACAICWRVRALSAGVRESLTDPHDSLRRGLQECLSKRRQRNHVVRAASAMGRNPCCPTPD